MPMYECRCEHCGEIAIIIRKIEQRDINLPTCAIGHAMSRVISAPSVIPDISPFISPNGKVVNSRSEWKEDLKRSHAIAWEPGIERDISRNKQSQIDAAFRPIEAAIDSTVSSMVAAGKLET